MVDRNNINANSTGNSIKKEFIYNVFRKLHVGFIYLQFLVAISILFICECWEWFQEKFCFISKPSLEGKVVLITGASAGIGEKLAHSFFNSGCRLILVSRRKGELERVKDELLRLRASGSRIYIPAVLEMDLGDLKSIPAKAKEALSIYEGIDILINNAGLLHAGNVLETDMEVFKKIMDVNYFGTLSLTKVVANNMKEKRSGQVVFVSSVQGKIAIPYSSAYTASKHAVQALADSLRAEVADFGIEVTVISPGYVKTDISTNALRGTGSGLDQVIESHRNGLSPEYVAERTLKAIVNREKDVVVSPFAPKLAIGLMYFAPMIFFLVMRYRARMYKK